VIQTSARLLALLSLLQERREWSGPELARRLEVGPRTIRRDIGKLRELGYPVDAAPGAAGGYGLGPGAEMPPLLLDDAEAVAVAVGLRSAAAGSIAGMEETSVRALAKLEQILPGRLRRRVRDVGAALSAFSFDGPRIDPERLAALAAACRDATRLRFDYAARDGAASHRDVDPAAVVHSGARWYLVAFDRERDDWRTFRVDRIDGALRPGGRGVRREVPGGDPGAFVKSQIRHGDTVDGEPGRIRAFVPGAELAPRVPRQHATVAADGPDRCIVTTVGPWRREFLVWMALMDVDIEVLGPPELAEQAAIVVRRLTAGRSSRTSAPPRSR
jgi:predicted DNA-binding transcriptional regulator YafY